MGITLSLLVATSLLAGDGMRTEVAVTVGKNKFDSASKMQKETIYGARVTFYETQVNKYGFQVGYDGAKDVVYKGENKKTNLHRGYVHLVIDGEQEYHVTPYIFMGGGYEYLSEEIKSDSSQGFVDLGLGFKYYPYTNFHLLIEAAAVGKFETRDLEYQAKLGLGYSLGEIFKTTQEPIDVLGDEKLEKSINSLENTKPSIETPIIETPSEKLDSVESTTTVIEDDMATLADVEESEVAMPLSEIEEPAQEERTKKIKIVQKEYPESTTTFSDSDTVEVASTTSSETEEVSSYRDIFVQMAAYDRVSATPMVNALLENGYDNTMIEQKGQRRMVWVGPFVSIADAKMARESLLNISSDAFIKIKK